MAFAAVTILMDTLQQHFLTPKHRFPLRNKTKVTSFYRNLCSLQISLEQDFKAGNYDEGMKDLEALMRDVCIELRFQIEHQLSLFYIGRSMKLRLESAQKLLPILNQAIKNKETLDFSSMMDALVKHFMLPVSRMPASIRERVKSLCTKLAELHSLKYRVLKEDNYSMDEKLITLREAKSVIIKEWRAPYLKKYMKQRIKARRMISQIFVLGIKLTGYIKKEMLKCKKAYDQYENSLKKNLVASVGGLEHKKNIAVGDSLQHTSKATIEMVGCEDEFNTIIDMLKWQSSAREIVSIVGMGGIGKTTLAGRIYGDASMISHFDCRSWVTISQEYNPTQVYKSLLHSLGFGNNEAASSDQLSEQVYKHLKGQRYLIVIDDIWSTEVWDNLRRCIRDDNNGSRILMTTRQNDVAEYACSGNKFFHKMRFLDSEESWNLFLNEVPKGITFSLELEIIAREIVKKCEGLPLAISVVAGLLSNSKQTFDEWEHIAKNVRALSLDHSNKQCANILNLSYTFLPHHLKFCFLSFGVFQEDHEVPLDKIVDFWVSEGFLKVERCKNLEDVAKESIQDLVNRNLVQTCRDEFSGEILVSYRMHDVLRELALREAKKENLLFCTEDGVMWMRHRRIRLLDFPTEVQRWIIESKITNDHCLNHFSNFTSFYSIKGLFASSAVLVVPENFRLVRALELNSIGYSDDILLFQIMSLVHLRCLIIRTWFNVDCLPLFMLRNLRRLRVRNERANEFCRIWRLPQLKYLELSNGMTLVPPRSVHDNLESIGCLDLWSCKKELFMMIPNLRKLVIVKSYGDGVKCKESNWYESLAYTNKLEKLDIYDDIIRWGIRNAHSMEMLTQEVFLPNLKYLTLSLTHLEWKDIDVFGLLPKLEVLHLSVSAVHGPKWKPKDGGFRQLKRLRIYSSDLQHWEATSDHFPVLEHLSLLECNKLEEIPSEFANIATLQSIMLEYCKDCVITSAERIRKEQQEYGNDTFVLQIQNSKIRPTSK